MIFVLKMLKDTFSRKQDKNTGNEKSFKVVQCHENNQYLLQT